MSVKIPIVKFLFRSEWRALNDALETKDPYESISIAGSEELLGYLPDLPACLIIASLKEKEDLVQIATYVKLAKKAGISAVTKIVVVNFSGNRQFEKAVGKLGILDIVEPSTNTKGLRFKMDFWMKSLKGQMKNTAQDDSVKSIKKDNKDSNADKAAAESMINWGQPVDCEDDIWILKKEIDCKRVLSKWMVKLMGPSPYVGQWTEIKPRVWRFDLKPVSKPDFVTGSGSWFFAGDQKPDFIWKENLWLFTGDDFELVYQDSTDRYTRMKLKNKTMTIAKNSEFAKFKEKHVIESFDKELTFKKEGLGPDSKDSFEDGTDKFKNLSGKGKTDHMGGGPLSGETDGTDKLNGGPLKGKNSFQEEELEDFDSPLSGEIREGKLLDEKLSRDEEAKGPYSVSKDKVREGKLLDMENDHTEHETKYRGHNEAEQFDAKELHKNKYQEEDKGPNSGTTSTDRLNKYYNDDNAEGFSEERDGAPYGGASTTDKLKSHYNGKNGSEESSGPMDGKSHTDKMPGHYDNSAQGSAGAGQRRNHTEDDRDESLSKKRSHSKDEASEPNYNDYGEEKKKREGEADVLSFEEAKKALERKITKEVIEKKLAEAMEDARITCVLRQDHLRITAHLDDFFDNTIMFTTEVRDFKESQEVMMELNFNYFKKDTKIACIGHISGIEQDGEGKSYLTVELKEEDIEKFSEFMGLYQQRQENITEFMRRARGL